jgi:hypothetical protein
MTVVRTCNAVAMKTAMQLPAAHVERSHPPPCLRLTAR